AGNLNSPQQPSLFELPDPDAASKIEVARHCVQRRRRADKVAGNHSVDFGPNRYAVWIEPIVRRIRGMFGYQLESSVELHPPAWVCAIRAPHHRDQEASLRKRIELVGYR